MREDSTWAWSGKEVAMYWWGWVILAAVVVVLLITFAIVVQRKRRRGGVIGLSDQGRSGTHQGDSQ